MSLLTSSEPNQQQRRFLNKMERYYHRRAGSNFVPKQKSSDHVQVCTKVPNSAVYKLEELMSKFMKDVGAVVRQFDNIDHYNVLQILRKHEFFSDISGMMNMDIHIKLQQLQNQNQKLHNEVQILKRQLKEKNNATGGSEKEKKNMPSYNSNKDIAYNLYYHAKALSEPQFTSFYHKVCLTNNIQLNKIYQSPHPKTTIKTQDNSITLNQKLNQLVKYCENANNQSLLKEIIQKVDSLASKKCKRPCCNEQGSDSVCRLNKAKTLMNNTFNKASKNYYKNDKSQEYFSRYYRGSSFNVNDITSVSKTKRQQMQRLQEMYRKNLKVRNKNTYSHRYSVSHGPH